MNKYTIQYGESVLDVSMRLYGTIAYAIDLVRWNPILDNINNSNISGLEISYENILKSNFKPVVTKESVIKKNVTINDFQSLFDVSLQIFGNISRTFDVVKLSKSENINDTSTTGKTFEYVYEDTKFPKYFLDKGVILSTKSPSQTTGFVIDENGNVIWDGLNELIY